jgi:RNA polymerase sigma-70 factor, ECF subfamily
MSQPKESVDAFLEFRPRLLGVAYRMLGTVADAEDAVQDAYLRFQQAENVVNAEAWLVKTTTRLCIDRLRQAKRRHEYHGPWLPEPVSDSWDGAARNTEHLAESLSMAFLVLLETLSPAERAAYLLREVLGYEFDEIARLLDTTPVNTRQLTARARKRLEAGDRRFHPAEKEADELADRFFAACQSGDLANIEAFLAKEVVLYSDGGGKVHAAPQPVEGQARVAKLLSVVFRKLQQAAELAFTTVNGEPGVVVTIDGRVVQILTFAARNGIVDSLFVVLNPDKLRHWPQPAVDPNQPVPNWPFSKGDDKCKPA